MIELKQSKVVKNTFELWVDGTLRALLSTWDAEDLALKLSDAVGYKLLNRNGEEL